MFGTLLMLLLLLLLYVLMTWGHHMMSMSLSLDLVLQRLQLLRCKRRFRRNVYLEYRSVFVRLLRIRSVSRAGIIAVTRVMMRPVE